MIFYLDKALEEDSRISQELYVEGAKLAKQKKYEEAIKFYTKALEINPKNLNALVAKGWTLDYAGFSNKDIFVFLDKALEIDPNYVEALMTKGLVLDRTGLFIKRLSNVLIKF